MAIDLLLQMTGLYLCIAIGFIAARKFEIHGKSISQLLFYFIVPLTFLYGISKTNMQPHYLLLPLCVFGIACSLCLIHYSIARRVYSDKSANILAFASGNGNLGYFGIPIAMMLFEPPIVGIYMMTIIGTMLFETTLGYYITTKGDFSTREALFKMAKLPMLHGALIGLLLSFFQLSTPAFLEGFFIGVKGAYSTLGMMVVGIALAAATSLKLDWKFIGMAFAVKFIAWPLLVGGLVLLDIHVLHLFSETVHHTTLLISFMPLAVNSVIFATLLDAQPEKMATAVFLSTLFALLYVPVMISLFIL